MRHSAVACDIYQTTDVEYRNDSELSNKVNCDSAVQNRKSALRGPSSGHDGDHTKYKGDDRESDRHETLDAPFCQAINTDSWD